MLSATNTHKQKSDEESRARKDIPQIAQQVFNPECTNFGPNRKTDWKEYFFCSNCRNHENNLSAKPNQKQTKNTYVQQITNHFFIQQLKQKYGAIM